MQPRWLKAWWVITHKGFKRTKTNRRQRKMCTILTKGFCPYAEPYTTDSCINCNNCPDSEPEKEREIWKSLEKYDKQRQKNDETI